jgi:allantoin racemase
MDTQSESEALPSMPQANPNAAAPIRILWQSSTPIHRYPAYRAAVEAHARRLLSPGTTVVTRGVVDGIDQLAFRAIDFMNNAQILDSVVQAEREGFDAVAIGCFLDPILDELREIVDIPVLSLAETGMLTACMVGRRFAILSHNPVFNRKAYPELVHKYRLCERAGPLIDLALPREVLAEALRSGQVEPCLEQVREGARRAIAQGADTILLGCGLLNIVAARAGLHEVDGAPIIDVSGVLMKTTESMVSLRRLTGLATSRVGAYQRPERERTQAALALYGRGRVAPPTQP